MDALIRVDSVVKNYEMGATTIRALRGVTTAIDRGDFVSIMGPSGSGKSTFMHILGCLDRPTSGQYILDGVHVERMDRDELAAIRNRKIGFVFQSYNLLARTSAIENVELPLLYGETPVPEHRARAAKMLAAVGMAGREDHHPNQLSGGQQQRVAIARALVNNPLLILADEPTGALDSRTSIEIMAILQQLNKQDGLSIVLVTHEQDIAAYASRMIQFRDGHIVDDRRTRARDAEAELREMPLEDTMEVLA
ncbi:MAG: ABC transporter ATP-binding protein [Phycisphaerales bacterium]|nr:ABC transporter ATP-binding protein [Phycisphaerales bacterium]